MTVEKGLSEAKGAAVTRRRLTLTIRDPVCDSFSIDAQKIHLPVFSKLLAGYSEPGIQLWGYPSTAVQPPVRVHGNLQLESLLAALASAYIKTK